MRRVLKVPSLRSGDCGRGPGIKGMVKGICSKSWQQAGGEGTEMRDIEKEDWEDLVTYINKGDRQWWQ